MRFTDFENFLIEENNKELDKKRSHDEFKYIQECRNENGTYKNKDRGAYDVIEFTKRLQKLTKNDLIQYILYLEHRL